MVYKIYFNLKRTVLAILIVAAILFSSNPANAVESNENCLQYEPAIVTLTGKAYKELYAGPPNHESIKDGDTPFTATILELDNPICVIAEPNDEMNETVYNIKEIQVNVGSMTGSGDMVKRYKGIINKKVVVAGSFYHRLTGYHRRRIVLRTNDLKLAEPQSAADIDEIDAKCLQYEPATVSMTGRLYKARFRSWPDTLSDEERERLFSPWILFLDDHLCVLNRAESKANESEYDVTKIQFVEDKTNNAKFSEDFNGKNVAVTGKLIRGYAKWHWTDVLMKVENLEVFKK